MQPSLTDQTDRFCQSTRIDNRHPEPSFIRKRSEGRTIGVVGDTYRFLATGEETAGQYAMWEAIVPPGGGPPPHIHSREEESFVVLEGEVTFFDEAGNRSVLKSYQGIMIPRGAYYRYLNTGPGNLMVLRVGAGSKNEQNEGNRIGGDGRALPSDSPENKHVEPVALPGKFFGA